jgi:hypothetical protein
LRLCRDQVGEWVAVNVLQAMLMQQGLDLALRPATVVRELVDDRRVLVGSQLWLGVLISRGAVDDREPAARAQNADSLVDRCIRVRQRPEQVPADDKVKAVRLKPKLLGVALLVADQ